MSSSIPAFGGAALAPYKRFSATKTLAQAEFISAAQIKKGPPQNLFCGADDPTNPTFITTVWGYGYKWGF